MARRKSDIQADAPGQDSFLDVVANLVGIMIILIMVVGFAAKKAIVEAGPLAAIPAEESLGPLTEFPDAPPASSVNLEELEKQFVASIQETAAVEANIAETNAKIKREKFEVDFRRTERDKILNLISAAEQAIKEERGKLNGNQQQQFDLAQQLAAAKAKLEELDRLKTSVMQSTPSAGIVEHLPTPMAKTVFGKEMHFRLLGRRLSYVPWDEFIEKFKADAQQKVRKMADTPKITETIGPVQGYWMRYTLKRVDTKVAVPTGNAIQTRVQLDRFSLISENDDAGEPVEVALQPQSEIHSLLRGRDPNHTTITVWVYPDSYGEFRRIKQDLFKLGFLCAARPMPEGHPIGGSPEGSRSSAQ